MDNTFREKFALAAMKLAHEKTGDVVIPYGFNISMDNPDYTDRYGNGPMVHIEIAIPAADVMKELNSKEEN